MDHLQEIQVGHMVVYKLYDFKKLFMCKLVGPRLYDLFGADLDGDVCAPPARIVTTNV